MSPTLYTARNNGKENNGGNTTMVTGTTMVNNGIRCGDLQSVFLSFCWWVNGGRAAVLWFPLPFGYVPSFSPYHSHHTSLLLVSPIHIFFLLSFYPVLLALLISDSFHLVYAISDSWMLLMTHSFISDSLPISDSWFSQTHDLYSALPMHI